MYRNSYIVLAIATTCGIAAAQQAPSAAQQKLTPSQAMAQSGGSLLRATIGTAPDPNQAKMEAVSWFAVPEPKPRTLKKHDLVTIIVREESEFKSEGSTDLKKEAALEAKIDEFIKLQLSNVAIKGGAEGANPPAIKITGARDFKGEATVDRSDSMMVRVTGEVIDVKPNGTIVLQARQRIRHDEEELYFVLSGTCRAEDVTPDNTILSTQMYDKDVNTTHKGAVRDTTKRGWMSKLLDVVNPF